MLTYTNGYPEPIQIHQYEYNKEINPSTPLRTFRFQDSITDEHYIYNQFI